jgi:hypothetical protein
VERRPNTEPVQWFLERYTADQLVLDPPYQRRSIWSDEYRRSFIDSVLRNYPCPAIYLQIEIEPGELTVYNVVDGKQRLKSLIDFTNNGFHLADKFADEGFEGAYWDDLSKDLRTRLVNYVLTIEQISETNESELREAFDRLNRNVARLTAQELRHARFPGLFLDRMESLADAAFWENARVATPANIRRMRDVEFVAELFVLTMAGVQDGKAEILDTFFAELDDEIPDEDLHRHAFDEVQGYLEALDLDWRRTRWSNLGDLYGLWGAILKLRDEQRLPEPAAARRLLTEFSETQRLILDAARARRELPGTELDRRYFDAVRQGTNKDTNRQERVDSLTEWLRA